jgi:predicted small secreted protein
MNRKNSNILIKATFDINKRGTAMIMLIKKIALIALLCYCIALLTSCHHTLHGIGKDMETLGSKMQKSSGKK